jgi:hypothetical protein
MGVALGVVFDVFRIIRITFKTANRLFLVALCDIIYVLIYGICLFLYSAVLARGQIRLFITIGCLTGSLLEFLTVGNAVTSLLRFIVNAVRRFFGRVFSRLFKHNKQNYSDNSVESAENIEIT